MVSFKNFTKKAGQVVSQYSFLIFIFGALILALGVVSISLTLYNVSGAAQLDLSRPGYVSVRSQAVDSDNDLKPYQSSGNLNLQVIRDFKSSFKNQADKIKTVDAFGGDPLSLDELGLNLPKTTATN